MSIHEKKRVGASKSCTRHCERQRELSLPPSFFHPPPLPPKEHPSSTPLVLFNFIYNDNLLLIIIHLSIFSTV